MFRQAYHRKFWNAHSVEFNLVLVGLTKRGLERTMMHIPRPAAPITPQLLLKFHGFMDLTKPSEATYWALFLIAFFTMARKSNLVPDSISEFDHAKHLARNRVIISEDCLLLFWSWAKNIQNHTRINKVPINLMSSKGIYKHVQVGACSISSTSLFVVWSDGVGSSNLQAV